MPAQAGRPRGRSCASGAALAAGWGAAGGYLAVVAGTNWASTHHVLTLGGLAIPAGACLAGLVFTLRDALHEAFGACGVLTAIAAGTVLSAAVAAPRIAIASAAAFLLAELADSWLYRRWRPHGTLAALAGSNLAGAVADTLVFVPWAFGSLALLPGQLTGKALTTALVLAVVAVWSRRREVPS
ncbi:VUT family protein [Amycolatopsis sp. 195334CR]|uniref:VUT family protein n=1 Tax=Amycolatopsis sp. 195334CR TaxID=2814588 RepID=UPI001A9083A3|nr:VUT family protein [Amycolatopsis sp. 195334CR]MBN6034116.1 VUT family protein [Amycolatopsis sp. 195334CR]